MRSPDRKPRNLSHRNTGRARTRPRLTEPKLNTVPRAPVCDFCRAPFVVTCFICTPRAMQLKSEKRKQTIVDDGHWVACHECAVLIRQGKQPELAAHSYNNGPPEHRANITRQDLALIQHGLFWATFEGLEHHVSDHPSEVKDEGTPS